MPLITSIPLHGNTPSTIDNANCDAAEWVSTLIRRALFLDCDAKATLEEAALYSCPKSDGRDEVILAAYRLCLSPDRVLA